MPEPGAATLRDKFGLPRIVLEGGPSEANDRPATRAPLITGGTITGRSFQTDGVNPRIVIDSTRFAAYRANGERGVTIDVATGAVDLLVGASVSSTLRFVNAAGTVLGDLSYISSIPAILLESLAAGTPLYIGAFTVSADLTTFPHVYTAYSSASASAITTARTSATAYSQMELLTGQADMSTTDGVGAASMVLGATTGSYSSLLSSAASSPLRLGAQGGNYLDLTNGILLFSQPLFGTACDAGQVVIVGVRAVATAATQAYGSHINWRHLRTDATGTAFVNPATVTIGGTTYVSTNAVTQQVRFLTYLGGSYTCNSIAAGVLDILSTCVVN